MMSYDVESDASVDAFADEVERLLDERSSGNPLWWLLAAWAGTGVVFTIALRADAGWLLAVGIALTIVVTAGFAVAKEPARWFNH